MRLMHGGFQSNELKRCNRNKKLHPEYRTKSNGQNCCIRMECYQQQSSSTIVKGIGSVLIKFEILILITCTKKPLYCRLGIGNSVMILLCTSCVPSPINNIITTISVIR
mmetsp:Transcript_2947/g.6621  ORF Transcript_2947/g.6621 Transcript_2947/m.6621 type:complete len:109 (-) Transcript_2947:3352-3678(-)